MGRFYKTSSASPLDYMYQANVPLMETAVEKNDQYIDQSNASLSKLSSLADFAHLANDDPDAQAISKKYNDKIDELTQAIQDDPANWRKHINPIRDLSNDLQDDYDNGAISKMVGNYNARKKSFDAVDEQVKLYNTSGGKKGLNPSDALHYKNAWDKQFDKTGYDPATKSYNVYKGGTASDNMDIKKILSDGLDKLRADKSKHVWTDMAGNNWFFNEHTQATERLTPEKVLEAAGGNITPEVMRYLQERAGVGLVDPNSLRNPYTIGARGLTDDEQASIAAHQKKIDEVKNPATRKQLQDALNEQVNQLKNQPKINWDEGSYFTPILKGLVNTYSVNNVDDEEKLKNNSAQNTIYTQGKMDERQKSLFSQQKELQTIRDKAADDRLQKNLDFRYYQWNHPHTTGKGGTSASATAKTSTGTDVLPQETGVSRLATNSFEDWETTDNTTNQHVKTLSNAGLSSDIDNFKNTLSTNTARLNDITKQLNNPHLDENTKSKLLAEKNKLGETNTLVQSELGQRRKWYEASTEAALNNHPAAMTNLQPEDVKLYREMIGSGDVNGEKVSQQAAAIKQQLDQVTRQRADLNTEKQLEDEASKEASAKGVSGEEYNNLRADILQNKRNSLLDKQQELSTQWNNLTNKVARFKQVKSTVDAGRDRFLTKMRSDVIDNDAIQPNSKDSEALSNIILGSSRGLSIYDGSGDPTSKTELEGAGISWFNSTGDNYNMGFGGGSLKDYIDKHNVKMTVTRVANSTKLGNGAGVAEVQFTDPNGEIPSGKTYYIALTPEVQKTIGKKFSASDNPEVRNIASQFTDDEGNAIRQQIMQPTLNNVIGKSDGEDGAPFTIMVNLNNKKIPLKVTKISDGNSSPHLNVTYANGEPFDAGDNTKGFFNGVEDFIQKFKVVKTAAEGKSQ